MAGEDTSSELRVRDKQKSIERRHDFVVQVSLNADFLGALWGNSRSKAFRGLSVPNMQDTPNTDKVHAKRLETRQKEGIYFSFISSGILTPPSIQKRIIL
jgi:hypothetical protein